MPDPIETALDALTRHNGGMPARREPAASMPAPALRAHQAITGTARLETLRHLLAQPGSTRGEVVEATGVSTGACRVALEQLEELGYVVVDYPQAERNGRTLRYTANRAAITADLAVLLAYVVS